MKEKGEKGEERRAPRARTKERVVSAIASFTRAERGVGKKGGGREKLGTADGGTD